MRALIFDLDGTLVDSTYQHAVAWQAAFRSIEWTVPAWEIHRLIGMNGTLLSRTVARSRGEMLSPARIQSLAAAHGREFSHQVSRCPPLPGAVQLLARLVQAKVSHGIATSGSRKDVAPLLEALKLTRATKVIAGDAVKAAKPEPDLFLACQRRLRIPTRDCVVIGDAVWDVYAARRSGIAAIGVRTGGFGEQELHNAGAMQVYRDLEDLDRHLDELGLSL